MRTINSYETKKQEILSTVHPYRIVRAGELGILSPDTFSLDGVQMKFTEQATSNFDKALAINTKEIHKTEGEELLLKSRRFAIKEFRNIRDKELAIVADSKSREIIDVVPMDSATGVSAEPFFDFAELIMEQGYTPVKISYDKNSAKGINLILEPNNKEIVSFAPSEDFVTNGLYMNWSLSGIELGHYFTRLICVNGAIRKETQKKNHIRTLSDKETRAFLSLLNSGEFSRRAFDVYRKDTEIAMHSVASMKEVREANKYLELVTGDENETENITHYQALMEKCQRNNLDLRYKEHLLKSDVNVWNLYNQFTQIATHSGIAEENAHEAMKLFLFADKLLQTRDIKNYIEVV